MHASHALKRSVFVSGFLLLVACSNGDAGSSPDESAATDTDAAASGPSPSSSADAGAKSPKPRLDGDSGASSPGSGKPGIDAGSFGDAAGLPLGTDGGGVPEAGGFDAAAFDAGVGGGGGAGACPVDDQKYVNEYIDALQNGTEVPCGAGCGAASCCFDHLSCVAL